MLLLLNFWYYSFEENFSRNCYVRYESVLRIRIRIILLKADPDPHQSEKPDTKQDPDPDLHQSQNSGAVEAHNKKPDLDPHQSEKRDPDSHQRDAYPQHWYEYL